MKKRLLAVSLAVGLLLTVLPPVLAAPFTDVSGHWAKTQIERWSGYNVLLGDQGRFRPENPITRAELAAVLNRVVKYVKTSSVSFKDVPSGAWYGSDISKLYAAGILNGDGDGIMRPEANITREEAATLFARAFSVPNGTGSGGFSDASKISSWALGPVAGMKSGGYIGGDPDGSFRPKDSIKRCEVVRILDSMFPGYANEAASFTGTYGGNTLVNARASLTGLTVNGSLYLTEGIGSGTVTLTGVIVTGALYVRGGTVRLVSGQINTALISAGVTAVTFDVWPNQVILEPRASVTVAGQAYTNSGASNMTLTRPANMVTAVEVTSDTAVTVTVGSGITGLTYSDFTVKVGSAAATFANATEYTGTTGATSGNYFRVAAGSGAGKYTVTLNKALTAGQRVWADASPSGAKLIVNPTKQYGVYLKPVTDLRLTARAATTATLAWTAATGAATVELQVSSASASSGFTKATYSGTLTAASASVTVSGLQASRQYWFKLVFTGGGPGKESNVVSTAGADMVTEVLLTAVGTATTTASVTLGSTKTGLTYADFTVRVGSAATTFANATPYTGVSSTSTPSGSQFKVVAGSAGKWTITLGRAMTTGQRLWVDGEPAGGDLSAGTAKQYCAYVRPVTNLKVVSRTDTTARLEWTAAAGASLIEVWVSYTSATAGFTQTTNYSSSLSGTSTYTTVSGLQASRQYWFKLVFPDGGPQRESNVAPTTVADIVTDVFIDSSTTATVTLGSTITGLDDRDFVVKVGSYNSTFANATPYTGVSGTPASNQNQYSVTRNGSVYTVRLGRALTVGQRLWVDGDPDGGVLSAGASSEKVYCAYVPSLAAPTIRTASGTSVTLDWTAVRGVREVDVEISYTSATSSFSQATYTSSAPAANATTATVSVQSGRACWFRLKITDGGPVTVSDAVALNKLVSGVTLTNEKTALVTLSAATTGLAGSAGYSNFEVRVGAASAAFASAAILSSSDYEITAGAGGDAGKYLVGLKGSRSAGLAPGEKLWVDGKGSLTAGASTAKQGVVYIPANHVTLTASNAAGGELTLSWAAVPGASGLVMQQAASPTGSYTKAGYSGALADGATSVRVTGLTGGVTYYFRLSFSGTGPATASAVLPAQTAPVVSGVAVSDAQTVRVTLSQAVNGLNQDDFVVKLGPDFASAEAWAGVPAGPFGGQFSVSGAGTSYTVTLGQPLSSGDKIWVDGDPSGGELAASASKQSATYVYIAPVTDLAVSGGPDKTSVTLSWTAASGASAVEMQQATSPTGSYTRAAYSGALNASSDSVTVTGLQAGAVYWFRLSVNGGAMVSNAVQVTTQGYVLTYDANGGTGAVQDPAQYARNAQAILLPGDALTPPEDNKVFGGWSADLDGGAVKWPGESIYMTGDLTVYAVWADAL